MKKSALVAGAFSLMLVLGACGSSDSDDKPAESSHPSSHHSASVTTETETETPQTPAATKTPVEPRATPQPEQDDNPGGHPCTDQSGAPGHLIPTDDGHWVCEITGDAPQIADRHQDHDDDPGGHPCTDQSGAPGHLIATTDGHWVCEITGDAPRS